MGRRIQEEVGLLAPLQLVEEEEAIPAPQVFLHVEKLEEGLLQQGWLEVEFLVGLQAPPEEEGSGTLQEEVPLMEVWVGLLVEEEVVQQHLRQQAHLVVGLLARQVEAEAPQRQEAGRETLQLGEGPVLQEKAPLTEV